MQVHLAQRASCLSGSVAREILSRTQSCQIVSFAGGLPDASLWHDLELPDVPFSAYQYGPSEGDLGLRRLLAQRMGSQGLDARPENTLILSGSQQGLDLVAKLLLDPATPLLTESPTYLAALQVFRLFQANVHAIALDSEGLVSEQFERSLRRFRPRLVYLNPSYHNPTGICYSERRRRELARILDRYPTTLVEDEPYRELGYRSTTPPPISSFLRKAPWIHLSSVSKILLPGLRVGSLACVPELFPHLLKLKQAADLHTSRISQQLATALLENHVGQSARLSRAIARYRNKRDTMLAALSQHFSKLADWQAPEGGMFVWLKLRFPVDFDSLLERALEQRIAFMPGTPFFARNDLAYPSVRLNFTHPSPKEIADNLPILASLLENASEKDYGERKAALAQLPRSHA